MSLGDINAANVRFIERLVAGFPQFAPLLDEHIGYFEELIPHNFMAEFTRHLVDTYVHVEASGAADELARLFKFLEASFETGDERSANS